MYDCYIDIYRMVAFTGSQEIDMTSSSFNSMKCIQIAVLNRNALISALLDG